MGGAPPTPGLPWGLHRRGEASLEFAGWTWCVWTRLSRLTALTGPTHQTCSDSFCASYFLPSAPQPQWNFAKERFSEPEGHQTGEEGARDRKPGETHRHPMGNLDLRVNELSVAPVRGGWQT